jgi:chromosome partitioning protein
LRRIAFINEKGGTCKTTLAVNVAAWLARRGARVLLCDLDTQGHAGKSLGVDVRGLVPNMADLLGVPGVYPADVIHPTPVANLDLIPGNKALADVPVVLAPDPERDRRLEKKLADLAGYDHVIFDAPPSMGLITRNVLLATEEVVIPVALTYLALDGAAEIVETVDRLRAEHASDRLHVALVVPTLYRKTALADAILAKLHEHFEGRLSSTVLGFSVAIDEAQSHGQTIWEYAPQSRGAEALDAISREIDALPGRQRAAS